jgi:hypothetical protein
VNSGATASTGDRQRRANQANAKANTGRKTRAGKERSARNALRHGLSIPVSSDPTLSPQAEAIARRIAGPGAKPETLERARRIGEAQIDLNRVRALRTALVADSLGHPDYQPLSVLKHSVRLDRIKRLALQRSDSGMFKSANHPESVKELEKFVTILDDRASELARLDRYERRALSRRKFGIREFDALRCDP